ncbi:MAG TPA: fimbria/pilus outer membrane usher protein [Solimonas sp.]|nr:fimbria/pilus outer membrane usher protein [Solimonas sp.]
MLAAPLAQAGNGWFETGCATSDDAHPARPQTLLLNLIQDAGDSGRDALVLRTPDGRLHAQREVYDWLELSPRGTALRHDGVLWYAFDALQGLRFAVNPCLQTLSLDSAPLRAERRYDLSRAAPVAARPEGGGYAQVDAQFQRTGDEGRLSGLTELGFFGAHGLVRSSGLFDGDSLRRLDSSWTLDQPQRLQRLTLGDAISRGGLFGRSLRYGGLQWGRDFSLRPDLVTFPLPSFEGTAALPSSVEVYVDQQLRTRQDVGGGPFELAQVPVISGSGQVQLVVTDLLGRSQVLRYDFYATPLLLAAGLDDYTLEAGFQRQGYGSADDDYGRGFAAGTWRRGLDDRLTAELHLEGNDRLQSSGAALSALLPVAGVVTLGIGVGSGQSRGGQFLLGSEKVLARWSYGFSLQRSSADYRRLGDSGSALVHRDSLRGSLRIRDSGALTAAWMDDRRADGSGLRGLALGYGQRLSSRWHLNLGGFIDRRSDNDSLYLALNCVLGGDRNLALSHNRDRLQQQSRLDWQRSAPEAIGWNARASAEAGDSQRYAAGADYGDSRALWRVDVEDREQQSALRLGLQTGVAWLGTDLFPTRPLSGPFVVVDTGSARGVRVYNENRLAGDSGERGLLLVSGLRPYQANHLSVAEEDYDVNQSLPGFGQHPRLPGYGGVRLSFAPDVRVSRRLAIRLDDGSLPPPGADLEIEGEPQRQFTGYEGQALVSAAPGPHRLQLRWRDGRCRARIDLAVNARVAEAPLPVTCERQP